MVFKKLLSALGVGAPTVDTVLTNPNTRPGLILEGHVNLTGGSQSADIEHVAVALVTAVEIEHSEGEHHGVAEFHRLPVSGRLRLEAGQRQSIPFQLPVPWETPITDVYGQRLPGMTMGLRTEVAIAHAVDKGDLDPVHVHPLPAQERILDAFTRLGFRFIGADLEHGRIHGVHQTLPFYQEIEFYPAPQYAQGIQQVELTFITNPHSVEIVLEFDKRGGMFTGGHDTFGRYTVDHSGADHIDWTSQVDSWVRQALDHHHSLTSHAAPGYPPHGHHGHGHGGSGMGGALAGAAGGFVAGMVAGEIIDEVFEGDDESEE
ncbi:MAG TPA: sporulation protein [Micromonosporaceae bacterium]